MATFIEQSGKHSYDGLSLPPALQDFLQTAVQVVLADKVDGGRLTYDGYRQDRVAASVKDLAQAYTNLQLNTLQQEHEAREQEAGLNQYLAKVTDVLNNPNPIMVEARRRIGERVLTGPDPYDPASDLPVVLEQAS